MSDLCRRRIFGARAIGLVYDRNGMSACIEGEVGERGACYREGFANEGVFLRLSGSRWCRFFFDRDRGCGIARISISNFGNRGW